jgi:RNA 3'-terminal phosphate cyclase (ATP)
MTETLVIDGSQGEGGGQVLRTSLSLAAVTGRPFYIENIRANRSRPGLRPQHLAAVRAVASLCAADVQGDQIDSSTLEFRPGARPAGGAALVDVTESSASGRSAGAVTLIAQAILWPLCFADGPADVTLRGGTFVPFSPPYHYLAHVAGPAFSRFGARLTTGLQAWGWMAEGGGEVSLRVEPVARLEATVFEPWPGREVEGLAAVTNLPSHIPHRMATRAHNLLAGAGLAPAVRPARERGAGPGAGVVLWRPQAGASSIGRPGLAAEHVAAQAVAEMLAFIDNGAAVDYHLADQLLVPMALAHGRSAFTTNRLTRHTLTNAALLPQWLDVAIAIVGELDRPGRVEVQGAGFEGRSGVWAIP